MELETMWGVQCRQEMLRQTWACSPSHHRQIELVGTWLLAPLVGACLQEWEVTGKFPPCILREGSPARRAWEASLGEFNTHTTDINCLPQTLFWVRNALLRQIFPQIFPVKTLQVLNFHLEFPQSRNNFRCWNCQENFMVSMKSWPHRKIASPA